MRRSRSHIAAMRRRRSGKPGTVANHVFSSITTEVEHPEQFDALTSTVRREDVRKQVFTSSDLDEHVENIERYVRMGIREIYIHNVNREQEDFIDDFGRKVLPLILDG